jgi:uncharacterized lipoprotein YddW (UPF0748 family)
MVICAFLLRRAYINDKNTLFIAERSFKVKRFLSILLSIFMLTSLCACGGDKNDNNSQDATSGEVSQTEASAGNSENSSGNTSNDSSDDTSKDESATAAEKAQFDETAKIDDTLAERGFKEKGANSDYVPLNYDKMKAMWISQFDFGSIYCNHSSQASESSFRSYVELAFDNLVSMDFNTVIVQVRPNADSFYPSAYYPWSHYILGSYGKVADYDPLEIMIEEAHERKLSFQAWINPMRGMSPANLEKIQGNYPMAKWKADEKNKSDYIYEYNKLCYINIAYEEVRQLIIDGAAEIVRNYDVDGVHMDDYFYFGKEVNFDLNAFNKAKRKDALLTLQKFRYNNLNTLVSGIYSAIKEENKNVLFGISPAGNLDKMDDTYYADVETWLSQDGYVDYIMPQIYFGMEHGSWSFTYTYERWTEITTNPNIKFMPGITFLKAIDGANGIGDEYAGSGRNEWIENKDVMKRCLEYAVKQPNFDGFALFSHTEIWDVKTGKETTIIKEELDNCREYFTDIIKGEPIKY